MRWDATPAGEFIIQLTEDVVGIHALSGRTPTPVVRCKDCMKTDRIPDGIVCKRFGSFYHITDPDGFCHEGEQWQK